MTVEEKSGGMAGWWARHADHEKKDGRRGCVDCDDGQVWWWQGGSER